MASEQVLRTHSANVTELEASNFRQGRHQALQGVRSTEKGLKLRTMPGQKDGLSSDTESSSGVTR